LPGSTWTSARTFTSLGIVLWEMVTGGTPFRGSAGELMYQHQHTPLPLEQLKSVPKPVVTLLEMLLEKDPARRFQNPTEMLKAMPAIAGAIEAGRGITRRNLQQVSFSHFAGKNSQAVGKTGTEENLSSEIAGYRKRALWS